MSNYMTNWEVVDAVCDAIRLYKLGLIDYKSVERDIAFIYGEALNLNSSDTWDVNTTYRPTIDELVDLLHPEFVSVDNPVTRGVGTSGSTRVASYKCDFDVDGIHLYVTI